MRRRALLGILVSVLLFAPGLAPGQDEGTDYVFEQQRPVLYTSVIARMAELLGGNSTESISACTTETITIGVPVNGQLDSSDCAISTGYVDFYVFAGVAGQSVTVTYSSAALSPLLATIQDYSAGTILTFGSGASPVVFSYVPFTTANYLVGVGTLKNGLATGPYTLLVTSSGGTSPGSTNLAPYTPSGWSGPIVVSTVQQTHSDASSIRETDTVFVDYAIRNSGSGAIDPMFMNNLYLDGTLKRQSQSVGLPAGYYTGAEDYSLGTLSPGTHTLRLKADANNDVAETNETDNEYVKIFTVTSTTGLQDTLVLLTQAGHPFGITLVARDPRTGNQGFGQAVPQNDVFGYFTIPTLVPSNPGAPLVPEVFVKMLDARAIPGQDFWFFWGGLTDLDYTLTVQDTLRGTVKVYHNPVTASPACLGADTSGFSGR